MNPKFNKATPGHAFKDGKLYWFEKCRVLVMTGWPDPRAWIKKRGHGWRGCRKLANHALSLALEMQARGELVEENGPGALPSGQLLLPHVIGLEEKSPNRWEQIRRAAYSDYLATIPEEIRTELMRYSSRRWHLMNAFARCPGAMDLSHGNPGLMFALASSWVFRQPAVKQPIRAMRSLVNQKQKRILSWLGFPGTETVRKILAKMDPGTLSVESLLYLRANLSDPFVERTLVHMERVNRDVIRLTTDVKFREHISPRLLHDLGQCRDLGRPALAYLIDTLDMVRAVRVRGYPTRFSSLKRLKEVHDELAQRLTVADLAQEGPLPRRFPEPPFLGTEAIRPIMTPDELFLEGREMRHCVAIHARHISRGEEFVYRVEKPVRATMAIRCMQGAWYISELAEVCNGPVDAATRQELEHALFATRVCDAHRRNEVLTMPEPDPMQLPLMSPDEAAVYKRCINILGAA